MTEGRIPLVIAQPQEGESKEDFARRFAESLLTQVEDLKRQQAAGSTEPAAEPTEGVE